MADVLGTPGNDFIHRTGDGLVVPPGFTDIPNTTTGDDTITGAAGDDIISGDAGNDTANFNISTDGADRTNLGDGSDVVAVSASAATQVRVTFTSAEVGNGNVNDGTATAPQDGGLAVRLQAENGADVLTGPVSRTDDEGITFVGGTGVTFDVRDLISSVARGDRFEVVTLGTQGSDVLTAVQAARPYYFNGGQGNDTIIDGTADDFLVGGAGNDTLQASTGNDSFIGGGGNDTITGGIGNDIANLNVTTDGADSINLGEGNDAVNVAATAPTQVRLTFTSAEVGNGNVNDGTATAPQDGGLAVRLQAEDAADTLIGPVTRTDDEGITFVGGTGVTFDVRDISGIQRGNQFTVATLGTAGNDTLTAAIAGATYYFNAGAGDDTVTGGTLNDFLVGGAGNDTLDGGAGNDQFLGGGGNDTIIGTLGDDTIGGGVGDDTANINISTDGADAINLEDGSDVVNVSAVAPTQVRLTFTSAEVGNGVATDGTATAPQDGGLAVRVQAEDGADALTGTVTRADDEGTTFVAGAGVTFDVRDLISGVQRGNQFGVATLGTAGNDTLTAVLASTAYYFNAGQGDDTVTGGTANDFLVGGAGNDVLDGGTGNDSFIGGGGNDTVTDGEGDDTAIFNVSTDGSDTVNLGLGADTVNVNAAAPTQVRLTFTSAEVGNGSASDGSVLAPQDGGLAVRLQAEDGADGLAGAVSRLDDEGVSFIAGAGVTFDVRDLVSGAARGDQFGVVTLGTAGDDTLGALLSAVPYYFNGGQGNDTIEGGLANDFLVGGVGNDTLSGDAGNDTILGGANGDRIAGGAGDDTILGGAADDVIGFDILNDGADSINGEIGSDTVNVTAAAATQVRLTLTSLEVGNGAAVDAATMANQDGGLAVRLQAEDGAGALTGLVTRADDEGMTFVGGAGVTFDVRDLVSGTARGDQFEVVKLGTLANDTLRTSEPGRSYYINGGQGDDLITGGRANDFLVGGFGKDQLDGGQGNDTLLAGEGSDGVTGGAGNDTILAAGGDDTVVFNIARDGRDTINGESGTDTVNVSGARQVRLTFTSAEVGNGNANDSKTLDNQDGRLAVRIQAENDSGGRIGEVTRADDEGISFVGNGTKFDVRDLVSGAQRGDFFDIVKLGTQIDNTLRVSENNKSYYINGGAGNDAITGSTTRDFVVGGAGNDSLNGGSGHDSAIGGGGADTFVFNTGLSASRNVDTIIDFEVGIDKVQLENAIFQGLAEGVLAATAFKDLATGAADADDRLLYDSASGTLSFDQDGSGRDFNSIRFAELTNKAALTASDFIVV